eukprot:scaffold11266_cov13-Tisochrysis_lutea.AAC.1
MQVPGMRNLGASCMHWDSNQNTSHKPDGQRAEHASPFKVSMELVSCQTTHGFEPPKNAQTLLQRKQHPSLSLHSDQPIPFELD